MIHKYIFGTPLETEAVITPIASVNGPVPYLDAVCGPCVDSESPAHEENKSKVSTFTYRLSDDDMVFGLGENVRGINKRGWIYESNCTDEPNHTEEKRSLYGAHNFLIVEGRERFGIFVDAPQKVTFDIGYTLRTQMKITVSEGGFALYVIEGASLRDIVKEFRGVIGRSYIPPKWAFGYGQSRWGYKCEADIRHVAEEHRSKDVPLDAIYLDIDYMERYKDFTVDKERFPDLPKLAADMREQGIHLVPIIDAGVKIEEGYPVYEEGMEHGYFCKMEDGQEYVAGVWPGRVHFPDMLNEEARRWFGSWYQTLLAQGIDGFWNDMNEPAMFYGEDHVKEIYKRCIEEKEEKKGGYDLSTMLELQAELGNLANRAEDYRTFYHEYRGEKIRHDRVHNLFGYYMTRAAGEAFERLEPEKRILMFSRSSYIGMHRYGGIWMGDNHSWWSHLLMNLKMLPSLNMCGFLYTGADLGGFGCDTTEDLMLRWLELGIFTPLMRNHSAFGTREQEFFRFADDDAFRRILGLRYALLPYLYSEYMKAALRDDMMFLPLCFVYPEDVQAREVEDQLMVGESMMIAPVCTQNAKGRYVYLPEEMKLYRLRSAQCMESEILPAGHHYVAAALDEVLVFVRPDRLVPFAEGGCCVGEIDTAKLRLLGFVKDGASYEWYDDDGSTKDFAWDAHVTEIRVQRDGSITVSGAKNPECRMI